MKKLFVLVLIVVAISCNNNSSNKNNDVTTTTPAGDKVKPDGEQLFKINCSQCHQPTQNSTGPALKAATDRWKDKALLYEYVKNSQSVIAKDPYAKALFAKWNGTVMQPFPQLSNDDIDAIFEYCNTATE
jgi:mono/diheme cytochrome c family protein